MMKLAVLLTMLVIIFIAIIYVIWLEVQKAITEQEGCYCVYQCLDQEILEDIQTNVHKLNEAWQL